MSTVSPSASDPRAADGFHLDPLGQLRYLGNEWRLMARPATMAADLLAAIAVALVALPLSLAIANASGVRPEVGLVTAVVGGVVAALFGGCRLQVSGPAAAMTFLVYEVGTKYGTSGLIVATLLAGLLQVLSGVFRLGRFMQFIPRPVVAGFLSGIGVTILCTQLPKVLGYDVAHNEEGGALGLLWQTLRQIEQTRFASLVVGATAVALMLALPRLSRKLPAPLIAVVAASLLPAVFGWKEVALLGVLPGQFPAPRLPAIPWYEWNELFMAALTIFFLASIESLLSASVVVAMSKESRVDNDQELVGQGLANMASALFGGIPVTGVIARSATNIQAGGRTRLSALAHALLILAMMLSLGPLVHRIPIAALAGILIAVALRMVEIHMLKALWHGSRAEAAVYLVTAGTIIITDLIVGVPVGMVAAFIYFVYEMSRLDVEAVHLAETPQADPGDGVGRCPAVVVLRIDGPLFFASGFHLRNLVLRLGGYRCVILDMAGVPFLDITGAEILEESIELLRRRGVEVLLARPPLSVQRKLKGLTQAELRALRGCPVYAELRDAMLHATTLVEADHLCRQCRLRDQCQGLTTALAGAETTGRTSVPRVRAVLARSGAADEGAWEVEDTRDAQGRPTPLPALAGVSIRPSPPTSWNSRKTRPTIHPSAFVDPHASVIGAVTVAEDVYIGPGVSVRADEGTPFYIGAESNLQDGVTLHALKGKVVLVQGRPYAIYVGSNVCLTHHALIHGPSYIGDRCFIGFKSMVHDAVVGEGCVLGLGATVVGVSLPPRRYVGHHVVVDSQEKADALPEVDPQWEHLRDEVVEVNQELAAGHLRAHEAAAAGTAVAAADTADG
ncbi:MAG TPA: SulP family inorganic anion transporter [Isosphaeraceae bacterium]